MLHYSLDYNHSFQCSNCFVSVKIQIAAVSYKVGVAFVYRSDSRFCMRYIAVAKSEIPDFLDTQISQLAITFLKIVLKSSPQQFYCGTPYLIL